MKDWRFYAAFYLLGMLTTGGIFTVGAIVDARREAATTEQLRERARELEEHLAATEAALDRARETAQRAAERQQLIAGAVDRAGRRLAVASETNSDIIELVEIGIGLLDELQGLLDGDDPRLE